MLELARGNAAQAGATNVEFLQGTIEDVPLPDGSVDVVISNCVINLSIDKPKVLAEMFRVLAPGGRIGISDVVADDHLTPAERAERGSYVGCIAGALSRSEYLEGLAAWGSTSPSVRFTQPVADGMHNAIIQATKPGGSPSPAGQRREHRGPDLDSCPARAGGLLRPCDQHGLLLDRRQGLLLRNYVRRCRPAAAASDRDPSGQRPARPVRGPSTTHLRLAPECVRPEPPGVGRRILAEAMGTGLLVAAVVGSGIAAERLSPDDTGLQLLENAIATGAALTVLIVVLQPVSAAFNPVITVLERLTAGSPPGRPPGPSRRSCSVVPPGQCWPT